MRKIRITFLIVLMLLLGLFGIHVSAETELIPLKNSSGTGNVQHVRTSIDVEIPKNYEATTQEFRGVWVSPYAGDLRPYTRNDETYKQALIEILDVMESNKLNAIIFHLRTHNDALYSTDLAPQSSYVDGMDYERWNYLPWLIDECHRRGIEFHAWLNPYRIASSKISLADVLAKYRNCPKNPANNPDNVLIGSSGVILDPGRPEVRDYLIDVCMELARNYDIDAIHFDDYFYISGVDDSKTQALYSMNYGNPSSDDFRRLQVDEFIEGLSQELQNLNAATGRYVQLGISPSGVYRNSDTYVAPENFRYDANGTLTYPTASNSRGFSHYDGYLFSDTKKWIDNEWIDYILPQVYSGFENTAAAYADVVDWWQGVVKYKKVNLYLGLGFYQAGIGWSKNPYELSNQILYATKYDTVKGICIYQYSSLLDYKDNAGLKRVQNEYWVNDAIWPTIQKGSLEQVSTVNDFTIIKGKDFYNLIWEKPKNTHKYAIFRSESTIDVNNPMQLLDIVSSSDETIYYIDKTSSASKTYQYCLFSISSSNQLAQGKTISTTTAATTADVPVMSFNGITIEGNIKVGNRFTIVLQPMNIVLGGSPTYEYYQSFDQNTWEKIREYDNPNNTKVSQSFDFTSNGHPIYIKVVATNDLGTITSDIIKIRMEREDVLPYFQEIFDQMKNDFKKLL